MKFFAACLTLLFLSNPAFASSCVGLIGTRAAKILVDDCKNVSPATRPPCNEANSCSMILSEIIRSCEMFKDIKLCKSYLGNADLVKQVKADNPSTFPPAEWPTQSLGKWIGPEGTFVVISKEPKGYKLHIQSLDHAKTYAATYKQNELLFTRNGKQESLRPATGEQTGMKWLLDKKNCLVIQTGEGFCR